MWLDEWLGIEFALWDDGGDEPCWPDDSDDEW